jgi:exosortase/archaeosortase family protein
VGIADRRGLAARTGQSCAAALAALLACTLVAIAPAGAETLLEALSSAYKFNPRLDAARATMRAVDDSFQFEIAGGCSGINSLMAITMLTAIFVHFTQDRLWKKLVLFGLSAIFAIIGNVARITVIMAVAKYWDPAFAGGKFHDYSAYLISFPFAFVAMYFASKVVNFNPSALRAQVASELKEAAENGKVKPASYDY